MKETTIKIENNQIIEYKAIKKVGKTKTNGIIYLPKGLINKEVSVEYKK